jgi:hypothetical protein
MVFVPKMADLGIIIRCDCSWKTMVTQADNYRLSANQSKVEVQKWCFDAITLRCL